MFKIFIGTCICHNRKALIVVKKGYCKRGNEEMKALKKINKNNDRPKKTSLTVDELKKLLVPKKNRKATGELKVYKEIWEERPHLSQISDAVLRRFDIRLFSHCLTKGAYPSLRLDKDNIWLETPKEHDEWEFGDRKDKKWDKKKQHCELLKQKYYQSLKTYKENENTK